MRHSVRAFEGPAILLCLAACTAAAQPATSQQRTSPTTAPVIRGEQPPSGDPIAPANSLLTPWQVNLSPEHREKLLRGIARIEVAPQPVPRAFAPATGMTAPPELKLQPLPLEVQQIPGIKEHYRFAMLERGILLIVGDDRLVVAMIEE